MIARWEVFLNRCDSFAGDLWRVEKADPPDGARAGQRQRNEPTAPARTLRAAWRPNPTLTSIPANPERPSSIAEFTMAPAQPIALRLFVAQILRLPGRRVPQQNPPERQGSEAQLICWNGEARTTVGVAIS